MFPCYKQYDENGSGSACLRMISRFYGKVLSEKLIKEKSGYIQISNYENLIASAQHLGFSCRLFEVNDDYLFKNITLPFLTQWNSSRYIVVYKIKKNRVYIADPKFGLIKYRKQEFLESWSKKTNNNFYSGNCLTINPTPEFFSIENQQKTKFRLFYSYLSKHRKLLSQVFVGMVLSSAISLIFPFLTKALVDKGINHQDISFVYLILIANLVLLFSQTVISFLRNWILLHVTTRISVSLISDFFYKTLRLPVRFFEERKIGDLMQRIRDHNRIKDFLMNSTLGLSGSILNFVVFGIVLFIFHSTIFYIFILGNIVNASWIILFLKKRKEIDYKRFELSSENQSKVVQIIEGVNDIKLHNYEDKKIWDWESTQARLFRLSEEGLTYSQFQSAGSTFLGSTTNILISIFAAHSVINGSMSLGMMMAAQSIMGQMKGPVQQLIQFINNYQDARISFERLAEIHDLEIEGNTAVGNHSLFPENKSIYVNYVNFKYPDNKNIVLNNIKVIIPQGKVTAIVGASGSGKTTLLKLILGFYKADSGKINIGRTNIEKIDLKTFREKCGVVMQNSFIFSDTVLENILMGSDLDETQLFYATKMANIHDTIESLPDGYYTKIGVGGQGLSQGQKQRLLIARAIYRNPEYIFLDEATNSLDTKNEKVINENLYGFFKGKTVIIIAHRLSTIVNSDQIIVIDNGRIVESGKHHELIENKATYFDLIQNQLKLVN